MVSSSCLVLIDRLDREDCRNESTNRLLGAQNMGTLSICIYIPHASWFTIYEASVRPVT